MGIWQHEKTNAAKVFCNCGRLPGPCLCWVTKDGALCKVFYEGAHKCLWCERETYNEGISVLTAEMKEDVVYYCDECLEAKRQASDIIPSHFHHDTIKEQGFDN